MGQAIRIEIREKIWELKRAGKKDEVIARELGVSAENVKRILDRGVSRITPDYDRCGGNGREYEAEIRGAAIELKRSHPGWGGMVIRIELAKQYARVPSVRSLQVWFRAAAVNRRRERSVTPSLERAKVTHEVWELDAKEQVKLADGSLANAMMAIDEASGALISATVFPPSWN